MPNDEIERIISGDDERDNEAAREQQARTQKERQSAEKQTKNQSLLAYEKEHLKALETLIAPFVDEYRGTKDGEGLRLGIEIERDSNLDRDRATLCFYTSSRNRCAVKVKEGKNGHASYSIDSETYKQAPWTEPASGHMMHGKEVTLAGVFSQKDWRHENLITERCNLSNAQNTLKKALAEAIKNKRNSLARRLGVDGIFSPVPTQHDPNRKVSHDGLEEIIRSIREKDPYHPGPGSITGIDEHEQLETIVRGFHPPEGEPPEDSAQAWLEQRSADNKIQGDHLRALLAIFDEVAFPYCHSADYRGLQCQITRLEEDPSLTRATEAILPGKANRDAREQLFRENQRPLLHLRRGRGNHNRRGIAQAFLATNDGQFIHNREHWSRELVYTTGQTPSGEKSFGKKDWRIRCPDLFELTMDFDRAAYTLKRFVAHSIHKNRQGWFKGWVGASILIGAGLSGSFSQANDGAQTTPDKNNSAIVETLPTTAAMPTASQRTYEA